MDEISNTYIGRFILTNGIDLHGQVFPLLYSDKFGDFPPVLPMYLSGITSYFVGLNELSARLPAAFFGSLMVIPLFLLLKKYSRSLALITAGVLCIFPWHVILSRASSEGIIALTVVTFGFLFLFNGITEKKKWKIFFSWLFFGLTYLIYPSFRILVPLIFTPLPFLFNRKRILWPLVISLIIFTILTISISSTNWGRGRFQQTSLFLNPTDKAIIVNKITAFSNDDGNHIMSARIFHNKIILYGRRLITQYFSYFSPEFLYSNDIVPRRYNVTGSGLIYISFILLILLFFVYRKIKIDPPYYIYLVYLLLIAPVPAALTVDDFPNVHRSLFMILPLALLTGLGAVNAYYLIFNRSRILKYGIAFCFFIFISGEAAYSSHLYYSHAGLFESDTRNIGSKEIGTYLANHHADYQKLIVSEYEWLSIYYLFAQNNFDKSLASKFQTDFRVKQLDNIEFVHELCPSILLGREEFLKTNPLLEPVYFVDKGSCLVSPDLKIITSIKNKDGTDSYRILHLK